MALPKITTIIHTITLPLSKKKIKIRPFLVKEEKIIMMAIESKEPEQLADTIFEVINNCSQTPSFNAEDLTMVDLQYIMIKLRAMSKGDTIDVTVKCNNDVPDVDDEGKPLDTTHKCHHKNEVMLNLDDLKLSKKYDKKLEKIQINPTQGIKLKPADGTLVALLSSKKTKAEMTIKSIVSCIEYVWDGEEVTMLKDEPKEDVEEFIDQLPGAVIKEIEKYIKSMPKLSIKTDFTCVVCGYKETLEVDNIQDFFQ